MKISLFITESSVLREECIEKDDDINTDEAIDKVMKISLARVAELQRPTKNSSMSTLKSKARKR